MRNKLVLVLASVLLVFTACKKEFTITVTSDNEKWGSVTGGGTFAKGTEIKIKATPKASYKFTKWDDDNTDNPRTIVVKKDATYTAIFEKKPTFTLSVNANNNAWGTTTGSGNYLEGAYVSIEAIPNSGYHFEGWDDGSMDNPHTITLNSDMIITATFAQGDFYIYVTSNNEEWGSVSGGGAYNKGATATLKATPQTNYKFVKWNDNNTSNPRTITVNANASYEAIFASKVSYTITVNSNNTSWGTVTGGGTYQEGTSATLRATAKSGYGFITVR